MFIIYKQKQNSSFNVYFPFMFLFGFCVWVMIKNGLNFNIMSLVFLLSLLIVVILFYSFLKLSFEIRSDGLKFGFGILKYIIDKEEIEAITIANSKDYFFSQGISIGKDKAIGFIARHGDGIIIETKQNKKIFVSLNNTKDIVEMLNKNNYV